MEISIKWKDEKKRLWCNFNVPEILGYPRNHALDLFSNNIPVVIKQDSFIISNDLEMRNLYRKKGHRVFSLSDLTPSGDRLGTVGFV